MKKNESNLLLLHMVFAVGLVISNVMASKLIYTGIPLFGTIVTFTGASACYSITYLMTDCIGEIWGRKQANRCVRFGFVCQVISSLLILFVQILPAADQDMQIAYEKLLGQQWLFVVASLTAYFLSQTWDVHFFHSIRDKYITKHGSTKGGRWIWNNAATITSQAIDTFVFIGIAFGIGFGWFWNTDMWPALGAMMLGQYGLKFVLAWIDTPIFYLLTRDREV